MDGFLAQQLALALHGSARLAGAASGAALEDTNSTFHFVSNVRFEGDGRAMGSVDGWLAWLAERGVRRIWLALPGELPRDRGAVTRWRTSRIVAGSDEDTFLWDGSLRWQSHWRTLGGDLQSAHRKPWAVTYRGEPSAVEPERPAVDAAAAELAAALHAAIDFAVHDQSLTAFLPTLEGALALGTADTSLAPYHPDLAPDGLLDPPRARLLASAVAANVFGGMASWNDTSFADADLARGYEDVSNRLFLADLRAFCAVVNA